jgi:hypothetical protein
VQSLLSRVWPQFAPGLFFSEKHLMLRILEATVFHFDLIPRSKVSRRPKCDDNYVNKE